MGVLPSKSAGRGGGFTKVVNSTSRIRNFKFLVGPGIVLV